MTGIMLLNGMSLHLSGLSLSIDESGNISAPNAEFHVSYDACITWAGIAKLQGAEALSAMELRRRTWNETDDSELRGNCLRNEFFASVQAVIAAATTLDALYAQLKLLDTIPKEITNAWAKNRKPRSSQVAETVRMTFDIQDQLFTDFRTAIKHIYRLRDLAVHPSAIKTKPYKHPELDVGLEWRFTTYRGDVADIMVTYVLNLIWELAHFSKFKNEKVKKYIEGLNNKIQNLLPDGKPTPRSTNVSFDIPPGI